MSTTLFYMELNDSSSKKCLAETKNTIFGKDYITLDNKTAVQEHRRFTSFPFSETAPPNMEDFRSK